VSRLRRLALVVSAVTAAWAALVAITGGMSVPVGPVRISSRSAWRPLVVALAFLAAGLWRTTADQRRRLLAAAAAAADQHARGLAAGLALGLGLVSATFGTHVAGGSDSSGYLSQSRLWAEGRVTAAAPAISDAPWPERGRLVAPFGYRPTGRPDELGPTYAPGLPWLMALSAAVVGEAGRFVWTPLLAGLFVWGAFQLAALATPPAVALAATLLAAGSPPVLFESTQTMSDLPVAALWLWVLIWLRAPGRRATIGAGLLAALALLMRPNLVIAAGAVWAAALAADRGSVRERAGRAALRAVPLAAAALIVAAINTRLWGSPFISGYGSGSELFGAVNVLPNLAALWEWTRETRGYWTALGLGALVALGLRPAGRAWWPGLGLIAGVLASYLPYAQFVEWWYLRFYLPAWPIVAAAFAVLTWRTLSRWSGDAARLALPAGAAVVALIGATDAQARGVFDLWRGEHRYAAVGRYVQARAGADAVIFAVQHSGAVAYYSGRVIARFDEVAPDGLDQLCQSLAAAGRDVWLVAESWEEAEIRARFASQVRGRLDWAPIAEARVGTARVRIYDLATPTRATGPALVPVAMGGVWPWARDRGGPAQ
jgi:hypothetical protein